MNPTSSLSLKQRILADEGPVFKVVQILCVFCIIGAAAIAAFHGPAALVPVLGVAGSSGYTVTLFAAEGLNAVLKNGFTPAAIAEAVNDGTKALDAIKAASAAPVVPDLPADLAKLAMTPPVKMEVLAENISKMPDDGADQRGDPVIKTPITIKTGE